MNKNALNTCTALSIARRCLQTTPYEDVSLHEHVRRSPSLNTSLPIVGAPVDLRSTCILPASFCQPQYTVQDDQTAQLDNFCK